MTGFDETVPPAKPHGEGDGASATPGSASELDVTVNDPDADGPGLQRAEPMGGDDEMISGQYGPTADYGTD